MSQLTVETLNPHIVEAQYAVRGELVLRALDLEKRIKADPASAPFDKVVYCNIGNPQALGQKPITLFREVLALVAAPHLLEDEAKLAGVFSPAAIRRARAFLAEVPGGSGAYSHSKGVEVARKAVARFIERRDGFAANPEHIFLTDGASIAVQSMIKALIRTPTDGIMIPIPQYPLYSAAITLHGGAQVGYLLNEEEGWAMEPAELERAHAEAVAKGVQVRALAVINPGNPTGQTLSAANMREVLSFCDRHNLVLLADEVYQENVWREDRPFVSFKRVASEVGSGVQLVSMHSVSKGFLGECGRRGGYMELFNFDAPLVDQLYKLASVNLCSNLDGQLMVSLMCDPPTADKDGEEAAAGYAEERDAILGSLKARARRLVEAFRTMEGVTVDHTDGSLYVFPRIRLPPGAVAAAKAAGKAADTFYCLKLLEETGVVVVPGSGFGQKDGTFHFRTTILPPESDIGRVVERMGDFHTRFMAEHKE